LYTNYEINKSDKDKIINIKQFSDYIDDLHIVKIDIDVAFKELDHLNNDTITFNDFCDWACKLYINENKLLGWHVNMHNS